MNTEKAPYIRDAITITRRYFLLFVALIPCILYTKTHLVWPKWIVAVGVGGIINAIRKRPVFHERNLYTSLLFVLLLPATLPLWKVAIGIAIGTLITQYAALHPSLASWAALYYLFPTSFATAPLWMSPHQTKALLIAAACLLITQTINYRTVAASTLASLITLIILNIIGHKLPPAWTLLTGKALFGTLFFATDFATVPSTNKEKWIYGAIIGTLLILTQKMGLVLLFAPLVMSGARCLLSSIFRV